MRDTPKDESTGWPPSERRAFANAGTLAGFTPADIYGWICTQIGATRNSDDALRWCAVRDALGRAVKREEVPEWSHEDVKLLEEIIENERMEAQLGAPGISVEKIDHLERMAKRIKDLLPPQT